MRKTFCQILSDARVEAAEAAWRRAQMASRLRHLVAAQGAVAAARLLSRIKVAAVKRAILLAPEYVVVGIDSDYHIGLPSVRWQSKGRLHLPVNAA